jgi:ElaB/YqjD/DUF883 family membrane-anchored ribosome-binding protein
MACRFAISPLSAAALLVALAGCGSDTEQVTAAALVSRGDQICEQGRQRFNAVQARAPANASAAVDQTNELVGIATDELNELRKIRPPEALRDRYDAYLEARARSLELLEQGRDAAEDKDADAYGVAQAKAAEAQPARLKLARAVGFKQCSKR